MTKSTKVACLLPPITSFSAATLSLSREHGSDLNDLNLDLQPLNQDDQLRPTTKHFSRTSDLSVPHSASHGTNPATKNSKINMKKNISRKLFFIVCIQGLFGLQQAYAATYYVSPTGSDANNGTSLSTPVKTIRQALSKARSTGDIVYVRAGTYAETVSVGQSGITLSAYQGEKPIIDGGSTLPGRDWGNMISVAGNNNIISGFEVKNSNIKGAYVGGYGIQVWGHHNTVSKMNVHHIWEQGIVINGDYNTLEDSKIWQASYRNANSNLTGATGGWANGITAARNNDAAALKPGITSYATIRRNTVFNNWGEGIACFAADHCTMEDNIVYDNWATNMYLSDATNSVVQRNLIYISSAPAITMSAHIGLLMADEISSVPRSSNNKVINNFIYNAALDAYSWSAVSNSGLKNVLIANNTVVDGSLKTGGSGMVNSNSQIRNNIITGKNNSVTNNSGITFSDNNWIVNPPSGAAVSSNIIADPQITRTGTTTPGTLTSDFFKVLGSSPIINAAMPLSDVPNDFFKVSRGTAPDIGGHEFQSATGATSPTSTTSPTTTTAPTTSQSTPTNIAKLAAAVSASSQNIYTNQQAIKAIDGVVSGYPTDSTREWATNGQKAGAWIQLNWSATRTVNKVVLYDRPNGNDQITSATLTFSNGSTVKVGTLNNAGGAVAIDFAPVATTSVRVTVNTVSGSTVNVGLSELEVFGY